MYNIALDINKTLIIHLHFVHFAGAFFIQSKINVYVNFNV